MKSTFLSGTVIAVLFLGMTISIVYCLNTGRILEKFTTVGRIDANLESGNQDKYFAEITAMDPSSLKKRIRDSQRVEIVVVSPEKVKFHVNGIVSGGVIKIKPGGEDFFGFHILLDHTTQIDPLVNLFSQKQYCSMEIYLRTKKIWEVIFEKGIPEARV
jgi:hypothetical protein